jgi:6-phosphogluconolactonase
MMNTLSHGFLAATALALFMISSTYANGEKHLLFVGTYTNSEGKDTGSKGIYAYQYDSASGKVVPLGLAAATVNPAFLAVASNNKFLYAVNEIGNYEGEQSGAVVAFALDRKAGKLTKLNEVASRGADPAYISLDRTGKYVLVANYTAGSVAVLPIAADGGVERASSVEEDKGTLGPNKDRQDHAHAHWIETSARNHFAYVADLGLDRVFIYKFDENKGQLSAGPSNEKDFSSVTLEPGIGPRHIVFSSDGKYMYVLGELDSSVNVFENDKNETWQPTQKISTLPAGFTAFSKAAEIAIHPNGKFLYASNRGSDSIAVFAIDGATGKLTLVQHVPSGGKYPRSFTLDSSGKRLFAANQFSDNIVEFQIDQSSGKLTSMGEVAKVPSPVCLVLTPQ